MASFMRHCMQCCARRRNRYYLALKPKKFKAVQMTIPNAKTALEPVGTPVETKIVSRRSVSCDGGGGAVGHPRVFLEMGDGASVDCPYCGCRFLYEDEAT